MRKTVFILLAEVLPLNRSLEKDLLAKLLFDMFKKVLIAEDMDDINKGVYATLKEMGVRHIDQAQYCDDAYLKVQKAIANGTPYDLLITDLSFKNDYRVQYYTSGLDLVKALREKEIAIPVIVYSVEDRLQPVRTFINIYKASGYVCKGRHGLKDLVRAVNQAYSSEEPFLSFSVEKALKSSESNDINDYDIQLLNQLAKGHSQTQISANFAKNNISPNSLSSIEKRLTKLKDIFRANNSAHLVAKAKDSGFI